MTYEIRFEQTPNPASLKFVANQAIAPRSSEFKSAMDAVTSPLARKIFGFPWTAGVFIGCDFVTVTKQDWVEWEVLAEPLAGLIREHLNRGEPVSAEGLVAMADEEVNSEDSEQVKTIKRVINQEIRPAVAMDGGDIIFQKYVDGTVYLLMQGSCSGCPSSTMTLKMGVEARLKEVLPEIKEVVVP